MAPVEQDEKDEEKNGLSIAILIPIRLGSVVESRGPNQEEELLLLPCQGRRSRSGAAAECRGARCVCEPTANVPQ